ncbi:MAG: C2 family cysteine protease [Candidatus Sericytochromatia bacterium]
MCNKIISSALNPAVFTDKMKNKLGIENQDGTPKLPDDKNKDKKEPKALSDLDKEILSEAGKAIFKALGNEDKFDKKELVFPNKVKGTEVKPAVATTPTEFAGKALALFEKIDTDKNGFISSRELLKKMNDPSIKGEDAAVVAMLVKEYGKIEDLSNDEIGFETSGVTKDDLKKLDNLKDDNEVKKSVNAWFPEFKAKIANNSALRTSNGGLKLPEKASEISYKDIHQGTAGDCYFLAPLASLAKTNPQKIIDMVKDNGDGTYNVNFKNRTIKVKAPTDVELALYANGGSWAPIIEKAYAVYRKDEQWFKDDNAYTASGSGGQEYEGIKVLGSGSYDDDILSFTSLSTTREKLQDALKNHKMIAGGINSSNDFNLPKHHAYAILDYDPKTDKVTIKNPWGHEEGKLLDDKNDGIFTMSLADFDKVFHNICYEE